MSKSVAKKVEEVQEPQHIEPEILTGSGIFMFPTGGKYEGEWKSIGGIKYRDGVGTFTYGPEEYQGSWKNDLMHGEGRYQFSSGACYTGSFVHNSFEGKGEYIFPDGAKYEGNWLAGRMHGEGEYKDADGVSWKGNFFNGMYDSGRSYLSLRPSKSLV